MSSFADARHVARFIWTHPANRGQRGRQLVRAATFQAGGRVLGRRVLTDVGHNGGQIWVDLHRRAATKALYANPPDWPNMLVWERMLRPHDLFIDVGANIGTYSILAASRGAEVIAIEPAKDTASLLRENVSLNGYSVQILEQAVGADEGMVGFSVGQDCINHVDPASTVHVPVTTLERIVGNRLVVGMKLDIEGYELPALEGAQRLLGERRVRLLQLEWNSIVNREPIAALLTHSGYELLEADPNGVLRPYHGSPAEDLFAAPTDLVDSLGLSID